MSCWQCPTIASRLCEFLHTQDLTQIGKVNKNFHCACRKVLFRKIVMDGGDGYFLPVRNDHNIPNSVKGTILDYDRLRRLFTGVVFNPVAARLIEVFVWLGPAQLLGTEKMMLVEFLKYLDPRAFIAPLFPAVVIENAWFSRLNTLKVGISKFSTKLPFTTIRHLLIGYGEGDRQVMAPFAEMLARGNLLHPLRTLEFVCITKVGIDDIYDFINQNEYFKPPTPWRLFFEKLYDLKERLDITTLVLDGHIGTLAYDIGTYISVTIRLHLLVLLELRILEMLKHRNLSHMWIGRGFSLPETLTLRCRSLKKLSIFFIHECTQCLFESLMLTVLNWQIQDNLEYLRIETVFPSDKHAKEFNTKVVNNQCNLKTLEIIDLLKSHRDPKTVRYCLNSDDGVKEYRTALESDEKVRLCVDAEKSGLHLQNWHGGMQLGEFVNKWRDRGLDRLMFYHLNYGYNPRIRSSFTAPKELKKLKRCTVLKIPLDSVRNVYRPVWYDAQNLKQIVPRRGN